MAFIMNFALVYLSAYLNRKKYIHVIITSFKKKILFSVGKV